MSTMKLLAVQGFEVKKVLSKTSRKEDDPGTLEIVLEASKDDLKVQGYGYLNTGDIMKSLNLHQESDLSVDVMMSIDVANTQATSGQDAVKATLDDVA